MMRLKQVKKFDDTFSRSVTVRLVRQKLKRDDDDNRHMPYVTFRKGIATENKKLNVKS